MNDAFISSLNAQKSTNAWIDALTQNMANMYTPGYRESAITFKNFLSGTIADSYMKNTGQGKSIPGTSSENVFLEGDGYFMLRRDDGKVVYSRLGEFRFDSEGIYKNASGAEVQGFILNDKGEIMQGAKLEITYDIIADTMDSEVDYKTEDYYIYGIPSSNIDDIIAPGIERLFDYLSNEISYDETNQTNIDSGWENIRNESMFETLVEDGYLSQEAFDAIKEYNQVLSTNAFADMKIERRVEHLEVSKVLSNTADDLIFDNDLEVNILTGRRTTKEDDDDEYTIPGDYVPSNGPTGGDDDYRYVTVTPPTGENQNYMPYIILGISAFIILGTGIIFIKKKVL